MLFVSRKPEYTTYVRGDVPGQRVNEYGMTEHYLVRQPLIAQFIPKQLTPAQRIRADLRFKEINRTSPYGAVPYFEPGVMGEQFAEYIDGAEAYKGYDPSFQLGKFDTATDINYAGQLCEATPTEADVRNLVEHHLLTGDSSLNVDYILLDGVTLTKPWPDYPVEGQGRHAKIEAVLKATGIDPRIVIEFEQCQENPGVGVIKVAEALIGEHDEAKADEDALNVEIPA